MTLPPDPAGCYAPRCHYGFTLFSALVSTSSPTSNLRTPHIFKIRRSSASLWYRFQHQHFSVRSHLLQILQHLGCPLYTVLSSFHFHRCINLWNTLPSTRFSTFICILYCIQKKDTSFVFLYVAPWKINKYERRCARECQQTSKKRCLLFSEHNAPDDCITAYAWHRQVIMIT